jgi:hypothetical protein
MSIICLQRYVRAKHAKKELSARRASAITKQQVDAEIALAARDTQQCETAVASEKMRRSMALASVEDSRAREVADMRARQEAERRALAWQRECEEDDEELTVAVDSHDGKDAEAAGRREGGSPGGHAKRRTIPPRILGSVSSSFHPVPYMYIYIYFYGFITVFASRYVASLVQPLNPLS